MGTVQRSRRGHSAALFLGGSMLALGVSPLGAQDPGVTTAQAKTIGAPLGQRLNTSGRAVDLVVPLRERVPLGQVAIRILPDDSVLVSQADLANALARSATSAFTDKLKALGGTDGFVTLSALVGAGLTLTFDPAALDLSASFGAAGRPDQSLDLSFGRQEAPVLPDSSADVSAFLSYQASWDYVARGFDKGARKPIVNFDLDGRLFQLVASENQFTYDGNRDRAFSRFASRLIHDRPGSRLRFEAGDLLTDPQVFQDQPEVAGVGVSKLLSELRPDRIYSTSAGRRVTLNEPATVTIIVNGVPARTLRLGPGNYDLQDLPLTGGANTVELLIEDAAGGRRLVAFDFFLDTELLAPGIDEFDAKLGIRSDYADGRRNYYTSQPIASGFYRRGLTEQLTAGVNGQATRDRQLFGGEAVLGTALGLVSANASFSHARDFGSGYAVRVQYRYSSPLAQSLGARRFDLLAEYRSRRFGGIESVIPVNSIAWTLSGRYTQPVNRRLSLGLGADYRRGRDDTPNRYAVRATGSYSLPNGMQFNGSAGYEAREGVSFGAAFFWRFGRSSLVTGQYDSQLDDARVGYFHSPEKLLDTVAWSVEGTRSQGLSGLNATAVWRTNRGDFEVAQRAVVAGASGDARTVQTALRARGTVAFADGQFALGRYLTDSFTIVSPHRSLGNRQVLIGSHVSDQVEARTGSFGPALVALSAYSERSVYFQVPDAPDGYDLGSGNATIFPWLHSGHRTVVGSAFNVTIVGRLLDPSGKPVSLISGTARQIGDRASPAVAIFTNREGRLGASGLAPGKWRLNAGDFAYEFSIAEGQGSFVDVAALRPVGRREVDQ